MVWLVCAAFLSRQTGEETATLSRRIAEALRPLVRWLTGAEADFESMHLFLRKMAHVALYLGMGTFLLAALNATFEARGWPHTKMVLVAALACPALAVLDEFQKQFIPGRHLQWDEVLLNFASAMLGIGLTYIHVRRRAGNKN